MKGVCTYLYSANGQEVAPSSTVAICRSRDKFIIHRLKKEAQVSANYIVGQPDPPRDLVTTALTQRLFRYQKFSPKFFCLTFRHMHGALNIVKK